MTRREFDAQFSATEQSTDFQFSADALAGINESMFGAVADLDADDLAAKSAADHAFEAAVASL